jgi:hypothetical protein
MIPSKKGNWSTVMPTAGGRATHAGGGAAAAPLGTIHINPAAAIALTATDRLTPTLVMMSSLSVDLRGKAARRRIYHLGPVLGSASPAAK